MAEESDGAAFEESGAELEVALLTETELGSGGAGAEPFGLALQDHEKFRSNRVVCGDGQGAVGAVDLVGSGVEVHANLHVRGE